MGEHEAIETRLADMLADEEYLRERIRPALSDVGYLAFTDLREVVVKFAAGVTGRVYDYGCGGAPYRGLFNQCREYVGADMQAGRGVGVLLKPDGSTPEPTGTCDVVLSSQVLEHVPNPGAYLDECFRILKPGGQLLVTTHGMFYEHGCPHDFHRWTSRGLEELVASRRFKVMESCKLTTEIRGMIQLAHYFSERFRCPERRWFHVCFAVLRRAYRWIGVPLLNRLGKSFAGQGIRPGSDAASIYIGISVRAQKPH